MGQEELCALAVTRTLLSQQKLSEMGLELREPGQPVVSTELPSFFSTLMSMAGMIPEDRVVQIFVHFTRETAKLRNHWGINP